MSQRIQRVRGMQDVLPGEVWKWRYVEQGLMHIAAAFGYQEIRTPVLELAELFIRSVGETTDIVGKEMYVFEDRGGDILSLRPEMTASIVRAVIENHLLQQQPIARLWYYGPMFRRERPQKGRYRQFHQYGAEVVGSPHPESDVEIISMAWQLLQHFGLSQLELRINTLGNAETQQRYRAALVAYLEPHKDQLSPESQARLVTNPLRILDSKNEQDRAIVEQAPKIVDFLDDESRAFFDTVLSLLDRLSIPYVVDPYLVRGLDYYRHTAFEIVSTALGAQNAVCGGGRYDGLAALLGGKPFPAVGFALGVERLLLVLEAEDRFPAKPPVAQVYIAAVGEAPMREVALMLASRLRAEHIPTTVDLLRRSVKGQLREANRYGVRLVVIVGEQEWQQGMVIVKDMASGEQELVAEATLVQEVIRRLRQETNES